MIAALADTGPEVSFGTPYQRRTDKGLTAKTDLFRSTSTTLRKRRQRGLASLSRLRIALLVLLLIVGSFFIVYQSSTRITGEAVDANEFPVKHSFHQGYPSTGQGIDVDIPRSETRRESQIVRVQDSDNEVFDAHVPPEYPVYHTLNQEYPGIERIHDGPPMYLVHDFLSDHEADFLIDVAESCLSRSLVGGEIESMLRTSDSCYFKQDDLPGLMQKITSLTGKPVEHCESPQVARYVASQQYRQHVDGFSSHGGPTGRKEMTFGGNRLVTVLMYLNDVGEGGETHFPHMNLKIPPTKGTALVFFPSTVDGEMDVQALHAALPAVDTKYVSQVWVRERTYFTGNPRITPKRLSPEEVAGWSS
jgi:hypothetical protein